MENHLLRHGEAMEAELKAMGAVQLGVREKKMEKGSGASWMMTQRIDRRSIRSMPLMFVMLALTEKACPQPLSVRLLLSPVPA